MADYPNFEIPTDEPNEDCSLSLLIEGGDTVDADVASASDDDEVSDSCDILPPHVRSTSSTGGDILASPFLPLGSGAEVLQYFHPKKLASGDAGDVFSSDTQKFVYLKRKASEGVKHFIFGKNVSPRSGRADVGVLGDVADSPNSAPSKPSGVRPTYQQSISIEETFRYNMQHKERGCFLIFNIETFDIYNELNPNMEPLKDRAGSDRDAFNLESAAYAIGFEHVRIIHNPTRREILQWVQAMAMANHSDYDCFACAILTHGGNGDILYARDATMKLTNFTRPFCADLCESLAGKPKLFFIQACRGVKLDHGKKRYVPARDTDAVDGPTPITDGPSNQIMKEVHIPTEADFLIANSTIPDYYAWRNESNGSWFIQSLCAVFKRYAYKMELMQMMTRVNRMVAYDFESSSENEAFDQKKQIPSIATRLTAEVYFTPKENAGQASLPQTSTYSHPSTSAVSFHSRTECETDATKLIEEQTFFATTSTQAKYPIDDYNVSPGLAHLDTKFIYPSPKNVTKPTSIPHPPSKACPRSKLPHLAKNNSFSRSIPKVGVTRKLSNNEGYSQSWNTPVNMHPSSTIPASLNQLSPHARRRGHRCSLPDQTLGIEPSERKGIKQTNL